MTMFGFAGMILLLGIMSVIVIVVVVVIASSTASKEQREVSDEEKLYDKQTSEGSKNASSTSLVVAYVIIIVGFVFFGVTLITMSNTIRSFESQIDGMNYSLMQSNNHISDLYGKIRALEEQDEYVDRFTFDMKEVTNDGEGVIDFTVYMRMLPSLGEVSLVLENSDGEIVITDLVSDSMILSTSVNVSLDQSYNVSVVVSDGEEVFREALTTINVNRLLNQYRGIKMDEDWDQEGFTMMFTVFNNYSLNALLAYEEVWIELYDGEQQELVSTRLLTVPDLMINDYQEFCFDVFIDHDREMPLLIKVTGIDFFGDEYVMFQEGW